MILSAQSIRKLCHNTDTAMISPFHERTVAHGMTFGLSTAGYDVRIKQDIYIGPGDFMLASTIERFQIPNDMIAVVHDKSSLARQGLSVFNTIVESGWEGWLTMELKNQGYSRIDLKAGTPIAQMVFHWLDEPSELPYSGRYQNQPDMPVFAIKA